MIALDSNIFIYMLEGNKEFGELARDLFVAIEQTNLDAIASELVFMEVLASPNLTTAEAGMVKGKIEELGASFKPVSRQVLAEAAKLRRQFKCGALDSIHIASAIEARCTQFITNDLNLLKKHIPEIQIIPLTDTKEATLFPRDINRLTP